MKNKDINDLLKKENNDLNIPLSNKILSISLQEKSNEVSQKKIYKNPIGYNLLKYIVPTVCSCVFAFIILLGAITSFYIVDNNKQKASNLTSYIIEINPIVCITADNDNNVISVCSLNNDGDIILSDDYFSEVYGNNISLKDCINKIMALTFSNRSFEINQNIRLFAINNKENLAKEKGIFVKDYIKANLVNLNFENIDVELKYMNVEKFSGRMNFEGNYQNLDDYEEEIQNKQRYFDPKFLALG